MPGKPPQAAYENVNASDFRKNAFGHAAHGRTKLITDVGNGPDVPSADAQ
jgi:hypothetical protein